MLADGSYGAVRERLLQGLVYCTDTGYAHLGSRRARREDSPSVHPNVRLCDDTLVIQGLVHTSVVLPSTNGGLETSLAPLKFALEGGNVQRRLSSRGSCWSRLSCGSSAVDIRDLVIKSRASFQNGRTGSQTLRPVLPRLQFILGMEERRRWAGEVTVCLG